MLVGCTHFGIQEGLVAYMMSHLLYLYTPSIMITKMDMMKPIKICEIKYIHLNGCLQEYNTNMNALI